VVQPRDRQAAAQKIGRPVELVLARARGGRIVSPGVRGVPAKTRGTHQREGTLNALDWDEDEIITRDRAWPEGSGLERMRLRRPNIRIMGVHDLPTPSQGYNDDLTPAWVRNEDSIEVDLAELCEDDEDDTEVITAKDVELIEDPRSDIVPAGSTPRSEPPPPRPRLASVPLSMPESWSQPGLPEPRQQLPSAPLYLAPFGQEDWVSASPRLHQLLRDSSIRPATMPTVAPQRRSRAWIGWVAAALALGTSVGAAIALWPQTTSLRVELAEGNADGVFVDGQRRCDATPCVVDDLEPGPRIVSVASGARRVSETHQVLAGSETIVVLHLGEAPIAAAPSRQGLSLRAAHPGVRVAIDGIDRGALPLTVDDLGAGEHRLRFTAERYEAVEKTVTVKPGEVVSLEGLTLPLARGRLHIEVATAGARVVIDQRGRARRGVDGPFPADVDLPPGDYDVVAVRVGHRPGLYAVRLDAKNPEQTVRVELVPAPIAPAAPVDIYE
jgi:hypothetical protein